MKLARLVLICLLLGVALAGCKDRAASEPAPVPVATVAAPASMHVLTAVPTIRHEEGRWPGGPAEEPRIGIPRLAEPFVADGELTEWAGALNVAVGSDGLATYPIGEQK